MTGADVGSAMRRLQYLLGPRKALFALFREVRAGLSTRLDAAALDEWSEATLVLVDVNAGATCLSAFWMASRDLPVGGPVAPLVDAAHSAAGICRTAGARAAVAALNAYPLVRGRLTGEQAQRRWWGVLRRLAETAPDCVERLAPHSHLLLVAGIDSFEDFVDAGLKATGGHPDRRRAFFALEDGLARSLSERLGQGPLFSDVVREVGMFLTALWGRPPILRALAGTQRRANIAAPLLRLPDYFPGFRGEEARRLFCASAAHASAHLALGGPPFQVGGLRPLQIALVNIVEDARIEALAMQQLPGLRTLWLPYHVAVDNGVQTAPALLARLARALFDPSYADDDGIVRKGRDLFQAAAGKLNNPLISREIGSLLGHDLGQMRVQFNAKTHVVEPIYRDDGLGLWDLTDDSEVTADMLEMAVEAARLEQREEQDARHSDGAPPKADDTAGKARSVAPDERGTPIAIYPEWDRAAGVERRDWVTVRAVAPTCGDPHVIETRLDAAGPLRHRITRLVRAARFGRARKLRRQPHGHDLDLDALLDAGVALRTGDVPDPRVFRSSAPGTRDMATVVLIDVSESTRDRTGQGGSILGTECLAVAALAQAMSALGDPFALLAFASNGREEVRLVEVKAMGEPYGPAATARLAGLEPGYSTRLGTALRHAGAILDGVKSYRKLVVVMTDGEPSDKDVVDPLDLAEDARRAVRKLKGRGIDSFGVIINPVTGLAPEIFGRANVMPIRRIEDLPDRLSQLYFRLARR